MAKKESRKNVKSGKRRSDEDQANTATSAEEPSGANSGTDEIGWSQNRRRLISVVIVLHLIAVFSAPYAIPEPSSAAAKSLDRLTSPYTNLLYMRHGYRFFAPDPGPSHLILFEVTTDKGEVVKGRFPDTKEHRPRLMYHRYFMISEHFWNLGIVDRDQLSTQNRSELVRAAEYLRENGFAAESEFFQRTVPITRDEAFTDEAIENEVARVREAEGAKAAEITRQRILADRENLQKARSHRDAWIGGVANYLKKKYNGQRVRIWIQEHQIPDFDHVLGGGKLRDKELYQSPYLVYSDAEEIQ